jgi:hypothetical protein
MSSYATKTAKPKIESYQRALRDHQARLRQLGLSNDPETP